MISTGSIAVSRWGTRSRCTSTPAPPRAAISASDEASPAAPRSWSDTQSPFSTSARRELDQLLAGERIADLHGRALVLVRVGELLAREDARAADAVPAGRRAVEDDQVPGPTRARGKDALLRQHPDAHRVHERVLGVDRVEHRLAADRGDADAVSVVADPGDRAPEGEARVAEAQPVEQRDRPRAHGDDVPEDPADARRGALEGLDRGRMVVALHLEGDRLAVADRDDAGVLAGALEHGRALGRKSAQEERRMLVTAVLRPEEGEHSELEVVRLPFEQNADSIEFPVRQAERAVEWLLRDRAQGS